MTRSIFASSLITLLLVSCTPPEQPKDNTLSERERADGWQLLFDGQNANGWRSFNGDSLPEGWVVEERMLMSLGRGDDIGGDIVYGAKEYSSFDLMLEWKLEAQGNSGIFYHVLEGDSYTSIYETGPEYQIIDDLDFPQDLQGWQTVGADYAMYEPDSGKIVQPAGTWNSSRIIFTPDSVVYFLNGRETVRFVPWSDDWEGRKADGKWKEYPDYGSARSGLIGLQDHGKKIWYRNIRIRSLGAPATE